MKGKTLQAPSLSWMLASESLLLPEALVDRAAQHRSSKAAVSACWRYLSGMLVTGPRHRQMRKRMSYVHVGLSGHYAWTNDNSAADKAEGATRPLGRTLKGTKEQRTEQVASRVGEGQRYCQPTLFAMTADLTAVTAGGKQKQDDETAINGLSGFLMLFRLSAFHCGDLAHAMKKLR